MDSAKAFVVREVRKNFIFKKKFGENINVAKCQFLKIRVLQAADELRPIYFSKKSGFFENFLNNFISGFHQSPGECPSFNLLTKTSKDCRTQCREDSDCQQSGDKCCFNGCGSECVSIERSTDQPGMFTFISVNLLFREISAFEWRRHKKLPGSARPRRSCLRSKEGKSMQSR